MKNFNALKATDDIPSSIDTQCNTSLKINRSRDIWNAYVDVSMGHSTLLLTYQFSTIDKPIHQLNLLFYDEFKQHQPPVGTNIDDLRDCCRFRQREIEKLKL